MPDNVEFSEGLPRGSELAVVDQYYLSILALRKQGKRVFDHAFAGILIYLTESGEFLLQKRDNLTNRNPNKVSIFGGKVNNGELPSQAALRELAEETGITIPLRQLRLLRAYVETRNQAVPVPVFRAIYLLMLDRTPSTRIGEGRAIVQVRFSGLDDFEELTLLSREDVNYFWDNIGYFYDDTFYPPSQKLNDVIGNPTTSISSDSLLEVWNELFLQSKNRESATDRMAACIEVLRLLDSNGPMLTKNIRVGVNSRKSTNYERTYFQERLNELTNAGFIAKKANGYYDISENGRLLIKILSPNL